MTAFEFVGMIVLLIAVALGAYLIGRGRAGPLNRDSNDPEAPRGVRLLPLCHRSKGACRVRSGGLLKSGPSSAG